ncbi:MAG TPA: transketolase C-terminal domain-containing protein, partial [Mycobacteriales bacterium]|nr:transketolase C-terminal domain-containing protein [Mycobacteriales bacterium]
SPAFLHLRMVRFMGHAGTDAEVSYRPRSDIDADLARDPVLGTARVLVECGAMTPADVIARYDSVLREVRDLAKEAVTHRRLASAVEVVAPLSPRQPDLVARAAAIAAPDAARLQGFGGRLPELGEALTLADSINRTLADAMLADPSIVVFGEDVGRKGGVYGVTRGLARRFGAGRVFDTLLDEQSILGVALGTGVSGLLPVPEIQYLAYLHNAEDQLRGEAASLSFFSNGSYRNPIVVRVAGLAYQKGFGGHFHNDNAVAALRDIPGLVVAVPSNPADAPPMLRTCLAAAAIDGTVSVFLEPIALYHSRDLHDTGDNEWTARYLAPEEWESAHVAIGSAKVHENGSDLTIVTFGNGVAMSLRAARRLREAGVGARVLDLRWLAPLPVDDLLREASATGAVLVADETRFSGGVAEAVLAALVDAGFAGRMARVYSEDTFVPLGPAAELVLLSEAAIEKAALELLAR